MAWIKGRIGWGKMMAVVVLSVIMFCFALGQNAFAAVEYSLIVNNGEENKYDFCCSCRCSMGR